MLTYVQLPALSQSTNTFLKIQTKYNFYKFFSEGYHWCQLAAHHAALINKLAYDRVLI